ncbi:MAG: PAS domain S-box protein [Saprospiraceae bacterium]
MPLLNPDQIAGMAGGLISKMDGHVFCLDISGSIRYANPSACDILGYEFDDLSSKSVFDYSPGLKKSDWKNHYNTTLHKGSHQYISYQQDAKGLVYPIHTTTKLIDKDDNYICCLVRVLQEVRHYSELLDRISIANNLAGFEVNLSSGYLLTTAGLLQLLKIADPDEVRFDSLMKKMAPTSRKRYGRKLEVEQRGGEFLKGEFELVDTSGGSRWFEINHWRTTNEKGEKLVSGYFKLKETELTHFQFDLDECQRRHIRQALRHTGGRVSGKQGASALLNMNSKTLFARMSKLDISRKDYEDHL